MIYSSVYYWLWVKKFSKRGIYFLFHEDSVYIKYFFILLQTKYHFCDWWKFTSYLRDLEAELEFESRIDKGKNIEKVIEIKILEFLLFLNYHLQFPDFYVTFWEILISALFRIMILSIGDIRIRPITMNKISEKRCKFHFK